MAIAAEAGRKMVEIPRDLDSRIGEILFDNGTLTEQDFKRVLAAQRERGECFSDAALRLGLVTELEVRRALARQCELPETLAKNKIFSRKLAMLHQPNSARAEAMRSLRSELLLRWFSRGNRILSISEVRGNHGAGLLAANLAFSFAQLGRRTVLIDANLRNPQQQSIFRLESKFGLVDFLQGRCNPYDLMHAMPGFYQLSVIFAGLPPSNPQELLSLASLGYLFESLQKAFDTVIVVGAPLLECADTKIIAARSGGCILSASRHRTHVSDIEFATAQLAPTEAVLVGVVLDG